ncbi:MAG: alpha/beta fold hydrolase, partial [Planctomycetota bacterium]
MRRSTLTASTAAMLITAAGFAQPVGELEVETATLRTSAGVELQAEYCHLRVPADRNGPEAGTIGLRFARIRSTADDPRPPVIYLAGGPGGSSTHQVGNPRALQGWLPVLEVCDLILLDQRGTGRSEPAVRVTLDELPVGVFLDRATAGRELAAAAKRTRKVLLERGVHLRGLDSVQAADDVDDVRRALGLETVSLIGFSYGTHLAQVIMRRHGDHLERVVLAG